MKPEHAAYLAQLGLTPDKPLFKKAERLLALAAIVSPEEPKTIFVSEFTKEDGKREFLSFWMFSDRYSLESKDFPGANETLDVAYISRSIAYVEIKQKQYDFKEAADASRLTIAFTYSVSTIHSTLRASKNNCDALRNVYLEYLKPNIVG